MTTKNTPAESAQIGASAQENQKNESKNANGVNAEKENGEESVIILKAGMEAAEKLEAELKAAEEEVKGKAETEVKKPEAKKEKSLQNLIIAARSKYVGKVITEKPYTEEKTGSLTKDQRDAVKSNIIALQKKANVLQSELLNCFMSNDAEKIEAAKIKFTEVSLEVEAAEAEAEKLNDVDARFKIPLKDMNGLELWIEELKLYQSLTIDAILELYKSSFKEGTEEYKKIALYQSSKLLVSPNPTLAK